ncbi:MAG: O-antigen ligase family protein [Chloroflexi bacterium]|nr:O-antigen ligase family protein [Chloroflexota bacterium]
MLLAPAQSRTSALLWGGLAVLAGVLVALLPVTLAGGVVVLGIVALAFVLEPTLALVLMLSVAPLKTLIATEAPFALPVDIGQLTFALAVGAWAVWRATNRRFQPLPRSRILLPLLAIMAGFSPSLWNAISAGAWLSEMLKWVEILLLVVIVLDLAYPNRWTWLAFGVVTAAVLQALIGLYEFRGGSGAPHLWVLDYTRFRAFGTFGQPNPFSAFMGLSLPLALGMAWGYLYQAYAAWRVNRSFQAWLAPITLLAYYGGCGVVILAGLLVSWGRGAWLGFGAAATVMVFFAPRKRWQGALLLVGGGALIVIVWLAGYVPAGIQQRITNTLDEFVGFGDMRGVPISDENFAIVERLAHWQAAYNMTNDHPWIGVGLGHYEVVYPEYGIPSWPRPLGHAHNDYLNILAETGILGLTVYLAGWMVLVYWTLRALRLSDPVWRGLVLGLLGTWTHLGVHSIVDKLYVNNLFLHIGVMLGLLAIAYQRSNADCTNLEREHDVEYT